MSRALWNAAVWAAVALVAIILEVDPAFRVGCLIIMMVWVAADYVVETLR